MIAAAFRYADSGGDSPEMEMLKRIDRYGVYAVMGRPVLYEHEIRRMTIAQNIVSAYRERARSQSWDAWLRENKEMGELLFIAQRLCDE
mgnify:CR=1 FL=1